MLLARGATVREEVVVFAAVERSMGVLVCNTVWGIMEVMLAADVTASCTV